MSNEFAKNELELIERGCKSEDGLELQKKVTKDILKLLDVFEKQGYSGFSASYVVNLFKRLVEHQPLSPLTGEDDEWDEPVRFFWPQRYAVAAEQALLRAFPQEPRQLHGLVRG